MDKTFCVIIPARYKSSRFNGKPLADIKGIPMIVRTYNQCAKVCDNDLIWVATDDERIKRTCEKNDIQVLMTSKDCLTGTDRLAECSELLDFDIYINVQGDEPVFNPDDLMKIIESSQIFPDFILNGFCKINSQEDYESLSTPKVVMREDNRLLYMTRAKVPSSKEGKFNFGWRQVCIYSFPKKALLKFAKHSQKTVLEKQEDIEILRFLEIGEEIKMIEMSSDSVPVDHPEDILRVEVAIKDRNL